MVYDTKTLRPLHDMTEDAQKDYRRLLTKEANLILFKAKHPILHALYKISTFLGLKSLESKIYEKHIREEYV